jgi:hypothetical protein
MELVEDLESLGCERSLDVALVFDVDLHLCADTLFVFIPLTQVIIFLGPAISPRQIEQIIWGKL